MHREYVPLKYTWSCWRIWAAKKAAWLRSSAIPDRWGYCRMLTTVNVGRFNCLDQDSCLLYCQKESIKDNKANGPWQRGQAPGLKLSNDRKEQSCSEFRKVPNLHADEDNGNGYSSEFGLLFILLCQKQSTLKNNVCASSVKENNSESMLASIHLKKRTGLHQVISELEDEVQTQ